MVEGRLPPNAAPPASVLPSSFTRPLRRPGTGPFTPPGHMAPRGAVPSWTRTGGPAVSPHSRFRWKHRRTCWRLEALLLRQEGAVRGQCWCSSDPEASAGPIWRRSAAAFSATGHADCSPQDASRARSHARRPIFCRSGLPGRRSPALRRQWGAEPEWNTKGEAAGTAGDHRTSRDALGARRRPIRRIASAGRGTVSANGSRRGTVGRGDRLAHRGQDRARRRSPDRPWRTTGLARRRARVRGHRASGRRQICAPLCAPSPSRRACARPEHARRISSGRHTGTPSRRAETQIVILTMRDEPTFVREAMRAGAHGYVLKEQATSDLIDAIRAVAAGGTYLSRDLAGRLSAERIRSRGWD